MSYRRRPPYGSRRLFLGSHAGSHGRGAYECRDTQCSQDALFLTLRCWLQRCVARARCLFPRRVSEMRLTWATKLASNGDLLSFRQVSASSCGTFKSTTVAMTTLFGHRHRDVPKTHPTPKPVATR